MATFVRPVYWLFVALLLFAGMGQLGVPAAWPAESGPDAQATQNRVGVSKGIVAVIGMPKREDRKALLSLVADTELLFYFQSPTADKVNAFREESEAAGVLGSRSFADQGDFSSIHLADNVADAVWVGLAARNSLPETEILRVLRPGGKAIGGVSELVKPEPEGTDCWSHPYHGPDNNPQSTDQRARAPYLTQFLAGPMFVPMPEISVAAGGRVFRAFGHIAHKANQNAMLNKLICTSAYNGTILWQRDLSGRFMIHRNTMIATPDVLYMADDESCKRIDAATGRLIDEIVVPEGISDGPVWKWMALVDGVLYALVGGSEVPIATEPSETPGLGHWPWGMWAGHEYKDPATSFGFGRTLLAIEPATKRVLWSHREDEYLDSRGVAMFGRRIYAYAPEKFLMAIDSDSGEVVWKSADPELLAAIGRNGPAQHYVTGYATTTYMKCNDRYIFFAGPQRSRLVVVRADNGKLLWDKEPGNYQLVLLEDVFYAAGPGESGGKLDYESGEVLATLPQRRACTRATGSIDSIFYRTPGGTVRVETGSGAARHIAPMRPPCQDGVLVSDGHLYWGPWMCGCQLSLYGHICLGPAGNFNFHPTVDDTRLDVAPNATSTEPLRIGAGDWPTYGGDNARSGTTQADIPAQVVEAWQFKLPGDTFPSAPVTAGGLVFFGDRGGTVYSLDAADGSLRWKFRTAGPVYYPPVVADGRLLVGSADGRVYALEATTGRRLWTFRAAPIDRWIPVYGKLMSTWPVAGGVIESGGTVYVAAGIAHYDGTYVYALDAATGKLRWQNDTSGATSEAVQSGASLQGVLSIRDGRLEFLGGGVHERAMYDLATGRCLNPPNDQAVSRFHTSFYAYFPEYGRCVSLDHQLADGRTLRYDVTYEGSRQSNLALLGPLPPGTVEPPVPESRWPGRRGGPQRDVVWQLPGPWLNSFILSPKMLLAAGSVRTDAGEEPQLAAINVTDGKVLWRQPLGGAAVKGGTALDSQGRITVSLENGRIVCFKPE